MDQVKLIEGHVQMEIFDISGVETLGSPTRELVTIWRGGRFSFSSFDTRGLSPSDLVLF